MRAAIIERCHSPDHGSCTHLNPFYAERVLTDAVSNTYAEGRSVTRRGQPMRFDGGPLHTCLTPQTTRSEFGGPSGQYKDGQSSSLPNSDHGHRRPGPHRLMLAPCAHSAQPQSCL